MTSANCNNHKSIKTLVKKMTKINLNWMQTEMKTKTKLNFTIFLSFLNPRNWKPKLCFQVKKEPKSRKKFLVIKITVKETCLRPVIRLFIIDLNTIQSNNFEYKSAIFASWISYKRSIFCASSAMTSWVTHLIIYD